MSMTIHPSPVVDDTLSTTWLRLPGGTHNNLVSRGAHPELASALGRAILARRRELSLSQEDVAYESDMSIRQYQRLEAGESINALVGNVFSIATALGWKLSELIEQAERVMRKRKQ